MNTETLWKFMERGIVSDKNRHDALVYFGRRVSRKTFIENVRLWARVIKGMGLKEGDELLLFGPSLPEFIYILLAADMAGVTANLPNLMASAEALETMTDFLPDGLRIGKYRLEQEHLKINIVGKIDRHYYSHLLTGYYELNS